MAGLRLGFCEVQVRLVDRCSGTSCKSINRRCNVNGSAFVNVLSHSLQKGLH